MEGLRSPELEKVFMEAILFFYNVFRATGYNHGSNSKIQCSFSQEIPSRKIWTHKLSHSTVSTNLIDGTWNKNQYKVRLSLLRLFSITKQMPVPREVARDANILSHWQTYVWTLELLS
jgi:hypothetical protein